MAFQDGGLIANGQAFVVGVPITTSSCTLAPGARGLSVLASTAAAGQNGTLYHQTQIGGLWRTFANTAVPSVAGPDGAQPAALVEIALALASYRAIFIGAAGPGNLSVQVFPMGAAR